MVSKLRARKEASQRDTYGIWGDNQEDTKQYKKRSGEDSRRGVEREELRKS